MEIIPQLIVTNSKARSLIIKTDMFKTASLTLNILMPIEMNTAENTVLSSFLVHSTKDFNTLTKLNAKLEELYGAMLSGHISKFGEAYRLQFSIGCIDDSLSLDGESIIASSLDLLLSALLNPLADDSGFSQKQLETEIRLAVEDIESEINDKRSYALTRMLETMCADEPYGLTRAEILENVKKVTPVSLLAAWKDLLLKGTVQLNVIGNIDKAVCEDKIRGAFDTLAGREPLETETIFVEEAEDITEKTEELPMNQSKLVIGFRTGMKNANDNFYAERIMTDVFGGGPYSRLFMNVREKLSLCYYCSARLLRQKGIMVIQSGIEKENKQKVIDEIYRQLEIMKNGEFTDEDFEASKRAICDAYKGFNDTPDGLDAYYGMQLFGEIATPEKAIEEFMKVTREDVIKAAQKLSVDTIYMLSGN